MFFARGQDSAFDGEHFRRLLQCRFHIAGDFVHCRDEKIAEAVPRQCRVSFESILEEFFHQRLGIGERDEAIAEIARRNDAQFLAQSAARAAVVGNRYDCRNVARRRFDPAKQHTQSMPAADHRDCRSASEFAFFVNQIDQSIGSFGKQHDDDRSNDLPRREHHHRQADHDNHHAAQCRYHIIIAAG